MGWIRIDDLFATHEKVTNAGPVAQPLHMAGLCYASKHLSDGFVPKSAVPTLVNYEEIDEYFGGKAYQYAIKKLIDEGLWVYDEERRGYWIHDYLDYNPSSEEVEAKRETDRRRKRMTRAGQETESEESPENVRAESERNPTPPVPIPVTNVTNPPTPLRGSDRPARRREPDPLFDAMVQAFGINPQAMPANERGKVNGACKQIRDIGGTPEQIPRAKNRYHELFPKAACTPMALMNHWSQLVNGAGPPIKGIRELTVVLE